jgi:lipopolysaccharide biosynthesis regulator YciM
VQDGVVGEANPTGGPTFKTQQEKENAAIKAFGEVAAKYAGSEEGNIARFFMATIHADQGRTAEAEKGFQVVAGAGGAYGSLAKFSLATLYQAQGKPDEAAKLLRGLVETPTILVSKEQAQIALARALVKSNPAEARKLLEAVQAEVKDRTAPSRAAVGVLGELVDK